MKLATFSDGAAPRIGVVIGEELVDLSKACPDLPTDMVGFLEGGDGAMARAKEAAKTAVRRPLSGVKLHAPVLRPPEFMIIGANYSDHAAEGAKVKGIPAGMEKVLQNAGAGQEIPIVVNKQASCINGPMDPLHMPRISTSMDFEGEFGFVIGKRGRHVTREQAPSMIAGYMVINDVSIRDWQFKSPTHTIGKSFETCGPCGPWLVTPDEIGDPHALDIKTFVNGELRQSSNTSKLIFDCFALVEFFSKIFTLLPGMIVSTGTCAGVGVAEDPPRFLKVGDVVEVEVEKIGRIRNQVIKEPASAAAA